MRKDIPTPRQTHLLKLLMEWYGKTGESKKSLGELLIEAGYSKESSVNPKKILESVFIKEKLQSFIEQLEDKRRRAITYITDEKLRKTQALHLAYITDIFTKNIQLLGGKETERLLVQIDQVIADKNNVSSRSPEGNSERPA